MVRPRKDMEGTDLDLQHEDYAQALVRYAAEDVERGVLGWGRRSRWWPTLSELIGAVEGERQTREARARIGALPAAVDAWTSPFGHLGIGLQVARGQFLMAEQQVPAARARFNDVVGRLGLATAREIADRLYHPGGDHKAIMTALEDAASREAAA